MENKKVLVTGGAGFIGSHLCERLVKNGNKVTSLDNYFTGSEKNHIDGVNYLYSPTTDIRYAVEEKPDIVYHLGEYSRVEQSFGDVHTVHEHNTQGTFQVLEFIRKTGAKLIYAGSSTKFSDNGADASPYAFTKAQNTQLVMNYGKWYDINYAITYFYNVYGGREIKEGKYATLIAMFLEKAIKGDNLQVVLPGTQKRNFTHVDDIVDGLILVGDKGNGDGYGIGHDESYSVIDVAMMFSNYCKVKIDELPEREGNRMDGMLNTKLTKLLGWKAKKNLKEYIKNATRK